MFELDLPFLVQEIIVKEIIDNQMMIVMSLRKKYSS